MNRRSRQPDAAGPGGRHSAPPGVRPANESGHFLLPGIPVRCRKQAAEEPPRFVRARLGWDPREISGAFGDLGTFLPHVVGAITVMGLSPAGILSTFGLFYIFTGLFYGLPIAVQPMKAASAVMLVEPLPPGAVAGAGLSIGLFFVLAGATGLIQRLARIIPDTVAAGLQLGIGLSLAVFGAELMAEQPLLGLLSAAVLLVLMHSRRLPGAIVALALGIAAGQIFAYSPPLEGLALSFTLPPLVLPSWQNIVDGFLEAAVPQIPLTLTNAIIVTAAVAREFFPRELHPVNERNLALTTGFGNLIAAPFGGYPMCHGAGGLAAHHRFGARSGTAPLVVGGLLLGLGLLCGDTALALLRAVPDGVLGGLLLFSGADLALTARPQRFANGELLLVLLLAAICIAINPAAAFVAGLIAAFGLRRRWWRP